MPLAAKKKKKSNNKKKANGKAQSAGDSAEVNGGKEHADEDEDEDEGPEVAAVRALEHNC